MAKQKCYLSKNDYDFDNISRTDKQIPGKEYKDCLKKSKAQASVSLSDAESYQVESSEPLAIKRNINLRIVLGMIALVFFMIINMMNDIALSFTSKSLEISLENGKNLNSIRKQAETEKHETKVQDASNKLIAQNTKENKIFTHLKECETHFKAKRLTTGKRGTALECYKKILRKYPDNIEARIGLQKIEILYVQWAKKALQNKQLKKALKYTNKIAIVNPDSDYLSDLKKKITTLQKEIRKTKGKRRKVKQSDKDYTTDELTEMSLGVEITDE